VQPNSPASVAGLASDKDYIIDYESDFGRYVRHLVYIFTKSLLSNGCMTLFQDGNLYKLSQYDEWDRINLTVYNVETDTVRQVTIKSVEEWGNE